MRYYVYELVNSIDNTPFYVGKGCRRRMYVHEHRARREVAEINENKKLRNKIKSIWTLGGKVLYNQIFFTDNAIKAYEKESVRIVELGIENLCNRFIFPPSSDVIYKIIAMRRIGYKTSETTKSKISRSLQGHFVSDETREKISQSQIGKKRPCSESRRIAIAESKMPKNGFPSVLSPDGRIYSVSILTDFCKEHNLHLPSMSMLLNKKQQSHRGWRLFNNGQD